MSSSTAMNILAHKIIDCTSTAGRGGIVAGTGLFHDFLNIFYEYYATSRTLYNNYKGRTLVIKELNLLVKELRTVSKLMNYSEYIDNDMGHLTENRTKIEQIDRAVEKIQRLIDEEWQGKKLFKNFKAVVHHFNNEVLGIIAPDRPPLPTHLAYDKDTPAGTNDIMFF